jgi:hypothetical protein
MLTAIASRAQACAVRSACDGGHKARLVGASIWMTEQGVDAGRRQMAPRSLSAG